MDLPEPLVLTDNAGRADRRSAMRGRLAAGTGAPAAGEQALLDMAGR
jgi:hypothetical protein